MHCATFLTGVLNSCAPNFSASNSPATLFQPLPAGASTGAENAGAAIVLGRNSNGTGCLRCGGECSAWALSILASSGTKRCSGGGGGAAETASSPAISLNATRCSSQQNSPSVRLRSGASAILQYRHFIGPTYLVPMIWPDRGDCYAVKHLTAYRNSPYGTLRGRR